jgi:hypothetical protein
MKKLIMVLAVLCVAAPAAWATTCYYSWEDCGTILGQYPTTGLAATNVIAPFPVRTGTHSLELVRTNASTTQAYVAWVKGLVAGDVVSALVYIYDTTAGGNPSGRIWAHYGTGTSMATLGSASGPVDYSGVPLGWGPVPNSGVEYAWTFTPPVPEATALVIEIRSYGNIAPLNVIYVDDLQVSHPDRPGTFVVFPYPGPSGVEATTWGAIKALYR